MQTANELKKIEPPFNYQSDKNTLKKFILFYTENDEFKYLNAIREMSSSLTVDLRDLAIFDEGDLAIRFSKNAFSFIELLHKVIDEILFDENEAISVDENDAFFYHRISRFKEKYPEKNKLAVFPSFLLRSYTINVIPLPGPTLGIREIKSEQIGSLIKLRGIVTKVSQVKPSVSVATYVCESCGSETYQQINTDAFDLLEECSSEKCRIRNVRGTLCLVTRGSKFMKFQAITVQELTSDVPHGSIPRMINIEAYSSVTDSCLPGEFVTVSGIFLPRPYQGFRKLKAGLLNDTYILAQQILPAAHEDIVDVPITPMHIDSLVDMFAPEIYGLRDLKKVLLLMLAGSPELVREDGMRIRGDINVLLLGDPGIAKSQLLKTVCKISKRGIYTTGKGASGVGLTAAVVKDPLTNEAVLEGGALVLADRGVCCIDELDKMGELDRVAIHEVMEQQSVSVSKSGINTTLNARCSVLAAANPVRGRYDPKKTVEQNIGLPASLLSRFDILCVLKDDANSDDDLRMASHVTSLHFDEEEQTDYSVLRSYISKARSIDPVLPSTLKDKLVVAYLNARRDQRITPRYLLALIRTSIAHARLRLSETVDENDVSQSINLLEKMKVPTSEHKHQLSLKHTIYNFIISLAKEVNGQSVVNLNELWELCTFDRSKVEDVISDFSSSGIWMRNNEEIIIFN